MSKFEPILMKSIKLMANVYFYKNKYFNFSFLKSVIDFSHLFFSNKIIIKKILFIFYFLNKHVLMSTVLLKKQM